MTVVASINKVAAVKKDNNICSRSRPQGQFGAAPNPSVTEIDALRPWLFVLLMFWQAVDGQVAFFSRFPGDQEQQLYFTR